MPGRALVDLDAVVGQDVGRLADVVPVVEPEREVVQRAVGPVDDRDVVRRVRALHPDAHLVAVGVEHLLGHPEAEHLLEERVRLADLLGVDEQWSIRGGAMPGRSGGGTGEGLSLPRMLPTFSRSQTSSIVWPEGISNRIDSPCPTSSPREIRSTWQPALARAGLELGEVVLLLDAEGEQVHADPGVGAQPQRVVVLLVPALEVDRVVGALRDAAAPGPRCSTRWTAPGRACGRRRGRGGGLPPADLPVSWDGLP